MTDVKYPELAPGWTIETSKDGDVILLRHPKHGAGMYCRDDVSARVEVAAHFLRDLLAACALRGAQKESGCQGGNCAHASDCAVHCSDDPQPCDCGIEQISAAQTVEPDAWLVTGPYTKQAFAMQSSAEAFLRGLNRAHPEGDYKVRDLFLAASPTPPTGASKGEGTS